MKKFLLFFGMLFCLNQFVNAQINLTGVGTSYTEDFDSYLGNSGTLPTGWTVVGNDFEGEGTGSANGGGYYSFRANASTERALGVLRSGSSTFAYTATFTNGTGSTITELEISYDFEQWRRGGSNTTGLEVTESGINSSVADLTQAGANGTSGAVNPPLVTPKSVSLTGLAIAGGATFSITFTAQDAGGSDNGVAVDNFSITPTAVLPVSLTHFVAKDNEEFVYASWTTSQELQNSHFEVQHSTDNRTFTTLEKIAGAGDSDVEIDYAYTHKTPAQGVNYYRLQQFDFDGQSSYSQVVSVRFGDNAGTASIYPNPVSEVLNVAFGEELTNDATAEIVNQSGSVVLRTVFAEKSLTQEVNTANLPAGVYFLRIVSGNEVMTQRFVKK